MADLNVDANVSHQLYVERLATTNANNLDPELKALAGFIRSRLAEEGGRIASARAMNKLVNDAQKRFGDTYNQWVKDTRQYLNELADYETGYQTKIIENQTVDDFTAKKPSNASTREKVSDTPMAIGANGGAIAMGAFLTNFSRAETDKVTALIKSGYYQGLRTTEIAASIAGTRANRYQDGVMAGTKRAAKAVSRTASDHVTNVAKANVYEGNERAVKGYILTAVLDSKTSKTCRGLDDTRVRNTDSYQPSPPFHVNCRTVKRPWLRSDLDAIKKAERQTRGADGLEYEPTAKQYYTWLKQQPAAFQDDVLGKTEGKIFRNAGLTPSEFKKATINKSGEPLTINEMAAKDERIAQYLADAR